MALRLHDPTTATIYKFGKSRSIDRSIDRSIGLIPTQILRIRQGDIDGPCICFLATGRFFFGNVGVVKSTLGVFHNPNALPHCAVGAMPCHELKQRACEMFITFDIGTIMNEHAAPLFYLPRRNIPLPPRREWAILEKMVSRKNDSDKAFLKQIIEFAGIYLSIHPST